MAEQPAEKSVALNRIALPFTVSESNVSVEDGDVIIRIEFGIGNSAQYAADAIWAMIR